MSDAEHIACTFSTSPVEAPYDIPVVAISAPVLASDDTLIPAPIAAAVVSNSNSGAPCRCEVCGVSGMVSNFYSPRFCSRECRYERNKGNHVLPRPDIGIITCRECGKVGSSTEFFSAKYCSKKCRYERGGRPPPQFRSNEVDASCDSTANLEIRLKAKRDITAQRLSASLPSEPNALVPPRATGLPMSAPIPRGFNPSSFHALQSSAADTATDIHSSLQSIMAANVAANWQLLVDYQPRDKDQTPSLFYLLDAVAALQESIVRASLDCVREETLLEATNRRLQELENDINACIAGASDAVSLEDRKLYYDIIRKMWADRALLQKDEIRMLEQLRKQQESKGKLRAQLLDKEQSLLTLGLTFSRRACRCPMSGCSYPLMDSLMMLRSHLDKVHGVVMQDMIDSLGWNAFMVDIIRKPAAPSHYLAPAHMRAVSKPAIKGSFANAPVLSSDATYAVHVSDLVSRMRTEGLPAFSC